MPSKQIIYKGHVQGVGFRYSVRQLASGFEVIGWVKNLDDGSVEMQVMSHDADELESFLDSVKNSSLRGNIREIRMADIAPLEGVRGFGIAR